MRATQQPVTLPPGFIEEPVGGTWAQVVGMTFSADSRLFVWEKAGRVWLVDGGVRSSAPLLDISEEVGDWRDFGLLGVALHPNFLANGYVYLFYVVDYHHLTRFGTPEYDPSANVYLHDTIGRITRYTVTRDGGAFSVDPASRKVLLGETIQTGVPILHQSHGTGTILFGTDGSLLASTGDGASYSTTDVGGNISGSSNTGRADGIIQPKEDVGSFRSQLLDSLSGKVLRLDPMTGDGLPSNPFYQPGAPRSARSRTWSLGLRNPFRMTLRPGTGSHNPADGQPGSLYIGDVGYNTWEELNVASGPGANFGWPIYEGLTAHPDYSTRNVNNQDAPNPLFGGSCTRNYFYFRELLVQDTTRALSFPNPCNTGQQIPSTIPRFEHVRPALDWRHGQTQTRAPAYDASGNATAVRLSAAGTPVTGPEFPGNCSVAGAWYTGTEFPAEYRNTYFHADYGARWIRNFVFDENDRLLTVRNFVPNDSANLVAIAAHPADGSLYYVDYSSTLRRIRYVGGGNRPPRAVAEADVQYGGSPHRVRFTGSGSSDPEMGPLTYFWDFGDGSAPSLEADPEHVFVTEGTAPTRFDVKLTVTDVAGAFVEQRLIVSVNNTPPDVEITSPVPGGVFSQAMNTPVTLSATVIDAEHSASQVTCEWTTSLFHNEHSHPEATVQGCTAQAVVTPVNCYDETYYFGFEVKVTDAAGLSTTKTTRLYPDCAPRLLAPKGPGNPLRPTYQWTPVVGADAYGLQVDDAVTANKVDVTVSAADAGCASGAGECAFAPAVSLAAGAATFRVRARNAVDGFRAFSAPQAFEVVNAPPVPVIAQPAAGTTFAAGQLIAFSGSATDPEDGALPASALSWMTNTGLSFPGVASGAFAAPAGPVPADVTLVLMVKDSAEGPGVASVTLTPRTVPLTFTTAPPGLSVVIDGVAGTTPFTRPIVEGAALEIAAATQAQGALTYDFVAWSDGGAAVHTVTASSATTFVATFDDRNAAPVARAGADQNAGSGSVVTLDGSTSSDPNGDALGYTWTQVGGPAVTLSSTTASRPTFTAPQVSQATALTFSLVVRDAALDSAPDTVVVNVAPIPAGLAAVYYNNSDFTGSTVSRVDAGVNFAWGTAAPVSGISGDTFSVRWTGRILPRFTETYTFTATSDAGIRVWINGRAVIDAWTAHTSRDDSGTIALVANQPYDIRIDYWENTGSATARLRWASASQASEYVPASRLGTVPLPAADQAPFAEAGPNQSVASGSTVTLDGSGSADPNGEALTYAWQQTSGTAVQLSSAAAQRPTFVAPSVTLPTPLVFALVVRDPQRPSAADTVTVTVMPPAGTGLKAEYFDNADLTGTRVDRLDARVDFSWGSGSPDSRIGANTFSARWTGTVLPLYTEQYRFTVRHDDGARLWVNGQQIVNNWTNRFFGATDTSGTVNLVAGQPVTIRLEYYENSGSGTARLSWSSSRQASQVVPTSQLYPASP